MSRYIDADAIKKKAWKAESEACFYALEDVVSVTDIDEAPSIDLVYCGECNRWEDGRVDFSNCELMGIVKPDDFCSYGERREQ